MSIEQTVRDVRSQIQLAAQGVGRDPNSVTLVAVSKTQPLSELKEYERVALDRGESVVFGENYLQEIKAKRSEILPSSELHMIGPLQSNKVRDAVSFCDVIESVHSLKVLGLIAKEAAKINKLQRILLQVNIGLDDAKSGFSEAELEEALAVVELSREHLQLEGLMTILPYDEDPEKSRPHFQKMSRLRQALEQQGRAVLFHEGRILLSMGMSNDFEIAIVEGADFVRVGTALFGERN
jgi:pyridoxal phosphate enzyme (YggS family)